eukprot:CAMPEP_0172573040 /NCGR_PEP_ID=MMETSP1067-20121228/135989_1 /TAXON_ID=265564 ORGANISM="Thalassiosira punctigera, Strain Tpunct2005C2" /NCGR_SAMPLE_ID=MMETSP1067 /ASSEMBLY_ACC=CAM_ASM_000444 /LENGTH=175 /DNA_ID=CAMNT_0013365637 /DNA_START=270 /DNA_END=797 /DNA_ORIENTATION=-
MREGRRFILGFLLLVTLALSCSSNIPLVYADAVETSSGEAEAVVDATGEVQVKEPESPKEDDDSAAAAEAVAQAVARKSEAVAREAEAEAIAAKAEAEAAAAKAAAEVVDEVEEAKDEFAGGVTASAKSKAMAFADKAKEVTPEQLKKVAAGALGIWGVAAGAGWVMNNLGGAEE